MEMINAVNFIISKKEPKYTNDSLNCSITIFEMRMKMEFREGMDLLDCVDIKITLTNDSKHTQNIK